MLRKQFLETSRGRIAALLQRGGLTAEEMASGLGLTTKEAGRCKNFFSLGLVYWLYERDATPTVQWLKDKFKNNQEVARANLWHRQLHIFIHAFYYIEYGIAQLGALQVWANSKRNKAGALSDYKGALGLGGTARALFSLKGWDKPAQGSALGRAP